MDNTQKTKLKQIIAAVCVLVVVAFLAVMPLIARNDANSNAPKASILSRTVQMGSIDTILLGGGTLAEEDAVIIEVPASVKLTKFLVNNDDVVKEGDPIAKVDRLTVMAAIAEVQQTIELLDDRIEAEKNTDTDETVTAQLGGTVKILYAQQGESVRDVMLEHGALAVLSLDGLMAVDLTVEESVAVGSAVTVTLSDGTQAAGKVVSSLAGEVTITLEDKGYPAGDPVEVESLGSGELYIYSPWNATAYAGTVVSLNVSEGKTVKAGSTLMTLSDVGHTSTYRRLVSLRQDYEDLMLDLFNMYQTEMLTAPCDGVVAGVDLSSVQLLSSNQQFTISLLSNAPSGDNEKVYKNFATKVVSSADGIWNLLVNPNGFEITDYKALSAKDIPQEDMTLESTVVVDIPVYALEDDTWVQIDASAVQADDIVIFALYDSSSPVWAVRIASASEEPGTDDPSDPEDPEDPSDPEDPEDSEDTTQTPVDPEPPDEPKAPTNPSPPEEPAPPSGPSDELATEQDALYSMDMAQIASVIPQESMTVDISVDELDLHAVKSGMEAEVKINALGGEKFPATVTSISNIGTNDGGSSKFTVTLIMDRQENMLAGMNASVNLVLSTTVDTLTIPANALVEVGARTIVYTGYDEKNGILIDPVEVATGISDGNTVQILDGLSKDDTYYYAYYDTLEISNTPNFGSGMMPGK